MEQELKPNKRQTAVDSQATSASDQLLDPTPQPSIPSKSPEDSPVSSMSSLSSLSHGFSPERPESEPDPHPYPHPQPESPPLDPLPELPPDHITTSPTPVPMVNRYVRDDTPPVKKSEHPPLDGFVRQPPAGVSNRRRRSDKQGSLKKIALGFRIFEGIFCLVSLSVMATDKRQGWAMDSYYRYKEFRYSMGVNVVGFAYAVLQVCDLVYQLATGNRSGSRHRLRYYLDFAMDQMLSYLLISSGSSAATRVDDWKVNWGADKFPELATASVGLGFAAFVAFAFSSVISGYSLYTATSS
ncbi:CASP-like protein 4A1 [Bidens hawaiensis]|uniref:CASP-like protein 4A1 n=1 Tax=Bidens hawaiensis TaxID=980011 RepID=UPI00404A9229